MKEQMRKKVLALRNALTKQEVKEHSHKVCEALRPFLKQKNGIYLSYGTEIDLRELLKENAIFAVPKTYADHSITFFCVDDDLRLIKGSYGIEEPFEGNEIYDLDVLCVPLVAFDESCHRLGHGAGYYDRYLNGFDGLIIGVAHECQKVDKVIVEDHDITLDMIISEDNIYYKKS